MKLWGAAAALVLASAQVAAGGELETWKTQLAVDDESQAEEAARKLAGSKDPKALDVMLDALALGAPPKVQAELIGGLAGKKDPRAIAVLTHYARNRNPELRKKSLGALAELNGPEASKAVPILIESLSDSVEEVRAAGALALGKRKEHSAEPKLLKLLQHKDEAAAKAIAMMATAEGARRIAEMLGQIPDSLLCLALGEMLKRSDFGPEPIRVEVVRTLGKVPGIDSTSALVEYIAATQGKDADKMRPSRAEAQKIIDQRSGR